jgi:hypothetical protein
MLKWMGSHLNRISGCQSLTTAVIADDGGVGVHHVNSGMRASRVDGLACPIPSATNVIAFHPRSSPSGLAQDECPDRCPT